MGKVRLGWPDWTQATVSVSPSTSGGLWDATLGFANALSRDLSLVARSSDTELSSTRRHWNLGASREIGLYAIPKHTFSKSGAYVRVLAEVDSNLLFAYEAGYDIAASRFPGTDARADAATCATYIDRNGVYRTVAADVLRESHFIDGDRHTLLELSRSNAWTWSEDFSNAAWTLVNATVSANATTAPDDTATMDAVMETTANNATHGIRRNLTGTTDSTNQSVFYHVKGGLGRTWIRVRVDRKTGSLDAWFNLDTGTWGTVQAGITTYDPVAFDDGSYLIAVTYNVMTGAGTPRVDVQTATADNSAAAFAGDTAKGFYLWGAQFELDASFPTSYLMTEGSAVTRAVDVPSFDVPSGLATPGEMTFYLKFVERGTLLGAGRAFQISNSGTDNFSIRIITNGTTAYRARLSDGAGATLSQSDAPSAPSFGDTVELRLTISSAGAIQLHQTINGGAEASGTAGSAGGFAATNWGASPKIWVNCSSSAGANAGATALQSFRICSGTKTLAEMQAAVYDSGWVDAFPTGLTAEDVDGFNVPWLVIPATLHTARYGSLQIDDYSNADGYVDIARLCVMKCYDPSINANVGANIGLLDSSRRTETDGGADVFDVKSKRRTMRFTLAHIEETEAFEDVWRIKRQAGISGQVFAIYNDTDTDEMHAERSFLGTLEEVGVLEEPNVDRRYATVFQIREAL